jgi:hypothetical protein
MLVVDWLMSIWRHASCQTLKSNCCIVSKRFSFELLKRTAYQIPRLLSSIFNGSTQIFLEFAPSFGKNSG